MSTTVDHFDVEIEVEAADGHVQLVSLIPCVVFITQVDTHTTLFEDYLFSLGVEPWYEPQMCECEIDWNCGCGRYGGATWIETRWAELDD